METQVFSYNYNREQVKTGILHIGVGNFHRAHEEYYTILHNHPEITQCEKTIYNYIDAGVFSVGNMDLPKKVTYKPRQSHGTEIDDTGVFEGRTYKDLQNYLMEYPDTKITEMDTVVGPEGSSKVLLTLHFCNADFMMAYLLDSKESVAAAFLLQNRPVDLSCGDVGILIQIFINETLIMSQIEIGFRSVLGDKNLALSISA